MSEQVMADVQQEGANAFPPSVDEKVKETPSAPPAENKPQTDAPSSPGAVGNTVDEVNVPFHKHPKWKQVYGQNQKLTSEVETLRTSYAEMQSKLAALEQSRQSAGTETKVPEWFSLLYGDNLEAWKAYQKYDADTRSAIKQEILGEINNREQSKAQEEQRWNQWVDKSLTELSAQIGVDLSEGTKDAPNTLRNEILQIAVKYQPTDEKGYISLPKAYEIHQQIKRDENKPAVDEKKKVAAISSARSKGEVKSKDFMTSKNLRHRTFLDLAQDDES